MNRREFLQTGSAVGLSLGLHCALYRKVNVVQAQQPTDACLPNCLPFCLVYEKPIPSPTPKPLVAIDRLNEIKSRNPNSERLNEVIERLIEIVFSR